MVKRIVCILLILLLLPACQLTAGDSKKNNQEPLGAGQISKAVEIAPLEPIGEGTLPEIAPLEPIGEGTLPEIAPLEPIGEGTLPEIAPLEPVGEEPAQTKPSQKPKNADWLLNVDDNVTMIIEGMKYHVNLYVSMSKSGGTDVTGTYNGKILYTCTMDEAELAKITEADSELIFDAGFYNFTMEAVSASIDVVKYDSKKYAAQTETKLEKADYMAVSVIDMQMRHQGHLWTHDISGEEGEGWTPDMDITKPVEVRFLINGGKVKAYIGNSPSEAFSGMLTGTPK